ncbi:protein phosphatase 1 regulatory subunit 35 [Malaclemys terrapin pileata]|uniref:protein phosphatase 1 regulatory subunit 35 n=1 Tax=Malaclemys terrapin pileata TaxID=2991368 RepID=UPI0023A8B78F|nr:protein phosphatase 1 regulatory subunit 35 [Malaclemys terrapin pileata]
MAAMLGRERGCSWQGGLWSPPSWSENEAGRRGEGPSRSPAPTPGQLPQLSGGCAREPLRGRATLAPPGDDAAPAAGPPPAPLRPGAPPPCALPALDLSLSPARAGGGILRRRRGARGRAGNRQVRFLLGSAPDEAPPSPEPPAPRTPPDTGVVEAGRVTTGFREAAGDLATPELHTSLALGEEVRVATHQGFDAHRAAQELLVTSFLARCSVEAKAAAGMNIPREQQLYQGLVSLQVPAEEVLSCALQEKLSLVRSQPEPRREPVPEGPDLLMFYEPQELVVETPYLGVEGLPPLRLQPQIRPPASTFLMFRKLQQWEA